MLAHLYDQTMIGSGSTLFQSSAGFQMEDQSTRTTNLRWAGRIAAIIAVVAIAWALRMRAVDKLPIDYDEDDYLRAAQQYAAAIQAGDWAQFTQLNYRTEHPPLSKILYGFVIAPLP